MRATVIQFEASDDRAGNMDAIRSLVSKAAAADKPDMFSMPEMWSCLGGSRGVKVAHSEILPPPGQPGLPGSLHAFLAELASSTVAIVHGGSIGERCGDRLFNTTLVFGRNGEEIARYRKIHLFDVTTPAGQGYRESAMFGAGTGPVTCAAEDITLGLAICYDVRFPELFLALRRAGAQAIMVPAAFTLETGQDHWEVLLRARAIETQCWIVAAATTGNHTDSCGGTRHTFGHSMICDPWGRVVATLGAEPGYVTAELDIDVLNRVREAMPVLNHRRLV